LLKLALEDVGIEGFSHSAIMPPFFVEKPAHATYPDDFAIHAP
jgi:hypothetical protein